MSKFSKQQLEEHLVETEIVKKSAELPLWLNHEHENQTQTLSIRNLRGFAKS